MSILVSPKIQALYEKHKLHEYGICILVIMPCGYQFVTLDSDKAKDFLSRGAKTYLLTKGQFRIYHHD